MSSSLNNSVCLNHPNRPAVARCSVCRKPICVDCIHEKNDMIFCSVQCMANGLRTVERCNAISASKKRCEHKALTRNLILLIIVAAAAIAGYYFRNDIKKLWNDNSGTLMDTIDNTKENLQNLKQNTSDAFDDYQLRVQRKQHGKKYDAIEGNFD